MAVEVRPAVIDDVDGIVSVAEAAWHAAHAPIVGEAAVERFLEEFYDADAFRRLIDDDAALLAVATADAVRGFVAARPDDDATDAYHLTRLYVEPDRWGEGIGRRLLRWAEDRAAANGAGRLTLGVMAANDRAMGFYEAAGYRRADAFFDDRLGTPGYTYQKVL
jgi:ribosomal protein S18 acetylase RimI-like enzyme